jgi:pimeloyl-ACP methyl ester carboxylesterase
VISVNAIKYRLGTFRLHVLLARRLCELGYFVFTFDPEGIGDSEGVFEHKLLSEHYYDIQNGKYNNDLFDAIDFFTASAKLDRTLALGLCGGAVSVLMEAGQDDRVAGLVLLNIPVLVEDLARQGLADNAAKITSSQSATVLLRQKLQRLLEPNFWMRLLSMRVEVREEFRLVTRSFAVLVSKGWKVLKSVVHRGPVIDASRPVSSNRLFNIHCQTSFLRLMARNKKILFLFAEHDPWTWIFASEFQEPLLVPGKRFEQNHSIHVLNGANHIFSGRNSQTELEQRIVEWLREHFPVAKRAA